MTEEQIKEQLSRHFLELIANRQGFKCVSPNPDHGVDLLIHRALPVKINGRVQYMETGDIMQVQLKSTCEASIERRSDCIKYDLEAKAYNALVYRRNNPSAVPFLLVLLVLPDDEAEWLRVGTDELYLRRHAYWWYPEDGLNPTENTASKRIVIPLCNALTLSFVSDRFAEHFAA